MELLMKWTWFKCSKKPMKYCTLTWLERAERTPFTLPSTLNSFKRSSLKRCGIMLTFTATWYSWWKKHLYDYVKWWALYKMQGGIGLNVAQMIVELIRDKRKIVDRITHDQIDEFIGLLQKTQVMRNFNKLLSISDTL